MGAAPYSHEPSFSYALYPCDHYLVFPCHLLLAIQRRSNNHLAPVLLESVHFLGKRVEYNLTCMPVMDGDGQEVEVMDSGFVIDADVDIAVRGRHMCCHVERDRECPALPQKLHNAL